MKASLCVLCDRATIREGLIHVLGGGINRLGRPVLPSPLALDLAIMLTPDRFEELPGDHRVGIAIRDSTNTEIVKVEISLTFGALAEPVDPLPNIPISIPLQNVGVSTYGFYFIDIDYDGQPISEIRFVVEKELAAGTTQMLPTNAEALPSLAGPRSAS